MPQNQHHSAKCPHSFYLILMISATLLSITTPQDPQNFTYSQSDTIIIKPNANIAMSGTLSTVADEYLTSSTINITNSIQQVGDDKTAFAIYNLYYFNLNSPNGALCYQNWVLGSPIPYQSPCPGTTYLYQQECHNYTGCYDEQITYSLTLNQWQQVEHIFYIHNVHPSNDLNLSTSVSFVLISSNGWFFWAVAMTCLLMIMIVVLSGVVFNLHLKLKRTKKVYEQHRLTIENEIDFVIKADSDTKSE